ncbi:MAG: tetratricopeptide repeat protein [Planctomycetota bacterium]
MAKAFVAIASLVCVSGCGSSQMKATDIAVSTKAFDDAVTKLTSKDYAGSKESAQVALKSGGLSADQASELLLVLVEAAIGSGDLDLAASKLSEAESFANDMPRVFVLKGLLARKRGDQSQAQAAFDKARTLDPSVRIPD